ncbi:hypothetical protein PT974_03683 [Cladobotryum mycophilum]|uniref:Uncharacterized protein n=1 Tax=Cladobotryum mycophilum TaxID=491253 RepID=A0ABR0STM3_9HYPO
MDFNFFEPSDSGSRTSFSRPRGRSAASHPDAFPSSESAGRNIQSDHDSVYEQPINDFNSGPTENPQFRVSHTPHSFPSRPPPIAFNASSSGTFAQSLVQPDLFNENQFLPFGNDALEPLQSTISALDLNLGYPYDHRAATQGFSSNSWANSPSYSSPSHSPAATAFSSRHSFEANTERSAFSHGLRPPQRQPQAWDEVAAPLEKSHSSSMNRVTSTSVNLTTTPSGHMPSVRRKMVNDLHICYRNLDLPKPLLKPRPRRRRGSGRRSKAAPRHAFSQPSTPSADESHAESPGYDNDGKETERSSPCESQGSQSDLQGDNAPWFACPYVKRDNPSLEKGCWVKLKSVAYVKQHLRGNHSSPRQCLECLDISTKDPACPNCGQIKMTSTSIPHEDKNSPIHQRGNKNTSHETQWERVYSSLFPNEENVPSPYLDPTLTLWMRHLIDFLEKHGRKRLSATYASVPEEQFQAAFSVWIIEALNQYAPDEVRASEMLLRWMDSAYSMSLRDDNALLSNMRQTSNVDFRSHHGVVNNAPGEMSGLNEQGGGATLQCQAPNSWQWALVLPMKTIRTPWRLPGDL